MTIPDQCCKDMSPFRGTSREGTRLADSAHPRIDAGRRPRENVDELLLELRSPARERPGQLGGGGLTVYCPNCGTQQNTEWRFCGGCGRANPASAPGAELSPGTPSATPATDLTSATLPRATIRATLAEATTQRRPPVEYGDPPVASAAITQPAPAAAQPPAAPPSWAPPVEWGPPPTSAQPTVQPPIVALISVAVFLAGAPFAYYGGRIVYAGAEAATTGASGPFALLGLIFGLALISVGLFIIFIGVAHAWVATALTQGRLVARPAGLLLTAVMATALTYSLIQSDSVGLGGSSAFELDVLPVLLLGLEAVAFTALAAGGATLSGWLRSSGHRSNTMPTAVALGQALSYYYVVAALAVAALIFPFVAASAVVVAIVLVVIAVAVAVAVAARGLERRSQGARIVVSLVAVGHWGLTMAGVAGAGDIPAAGLNFADVVALCWGPLVIGLLWFTPEAGSWFAGGSPPPAGAGTRPDDTFAQQIGSSHYLRDMGYGYEPPVSLHKTP